MREDRNADVLVIGSGFGGSVAALRLAEKGYRVVVLERGRRWRPQDFPPTSRALRRYLWAPRLGMYGIQALSFFRHVLVLHGTGVGGGSLVYANNLIHPPPEAFDADVWGGEGWGERLEPHYAEARRMLGAVTCPDVGATDRILAEVARELPGAPELRRNDVGVFFGAPGVEVADPYFDGLGPPRTGCTRCAACMVGCRVGAKNTLDMNYLWLAERLGARIVPETEALAVRPDGEDYVVETRRSLGLRRPRSVWRARKVVVAAGVLGTVRLLAESRRRGWLSGLSPRLGDFVRTNSEAILVAERRKRDVDFGDHVAITSGVQADAHTYVEMVRFNRGSDALFWLAAPLPDHSPSGGVDGGALATLAEAVRGLIPWGRAARSAIVLAMQPTEGHLRLELRRRLLPWPGRRLVSRLPEGQPAPAARIPVAERITHEIARRIDGVARQGLWNLVAGAPTTAHILGGCRIGASPAEGVVDAAGRVHGYPGLYVTDGSVVPSNLGVNPSLTITALAEYFMSQVPEAS